MGALPETALAPAWCSAYSGEKFRASKLFPPMSWLPRYFTPGHPTSEDLEAAGELPYSRAIACLAFALLASLPVEAGLYSSFAPPAL